MQGCSQPAIITSSSSTRGTQRNNIPRSLQPAMHRSMSNQNCLEPTSVHECSLIIPHVHYSTARRIPLQPVLHRLTYDYCLSSGRRSGAQGKNKEAD
mmetsp:Transcript_22860/g.58256  ORF Transcript_22860/g.58256 Transcript_22860/m.58256 type:complete len:97 (-) Transcript_22860:421-711(-)